jgi:hypothetical protein
MSKSTLNRKVSASISALCLLALVGVGCKLSSLPGAKMNMFEGSNAQDGATKIKAKLGVDHVKVHRIEIHEDRMSVVVQDPTKPKNFDEYTYEKGKLEGPKPVEALVLGNQEFTADKSRLFDLDEVNLGGVAEVCRKAVEHAQVEQGKCEIISVDWESASWTRSKAENEKKGAERREKQMRSGNLDFSSGDLAVTWRVWIRGPRATKDFWVDLKGNVWDYH